MLDSITLGVAGGKAFASASAARNTNEALQNRADAEGSAANVQLQQLSNSSQLERAKLVREQERVVGALRVASAESGVAGPGSSFETLQRQADADTLLEQAIIDQNQVNQGNLIRSRVQASVAQLQSQSQNVLLSAFLGGLGGLQSGLQISGAVKEIEKLEQTKSQIAASGGGA